jgi:hypothetical protein
MAAPSSHTDRSRPAAVDNESPTAGQLAASFFPQQSERSHNQADKKSQSAAFFQ